MKYLLFARLRAGSQNTVINKADTFLPNKLSNLTMRNMSEMTTENNCNCEKC